MSDYFDVNNIFVVFVLFFVLYWYLFKQLLVGYAELY